MRLLVFFSYTCMNCVRSLKQIKRLSTYKDLKIELIHIPEWEFEKNEKEVKKFLKKQKITFPLIMDNEKKLLKKYGVDFWPSHVLLKNDKVIYKSIGEKYKGIEKKIREELSGKEVFKEEVQVSHYPCLYFGKKKGSAPFHKQGKWTITKEFMKGKGSVAFPTFGKKVFCVMDAEKAFVEVQQGKTIKRILVQKPDLYQIMKFPTDRRRKIIIKSNQTIHIYSVSAA